MKIDTLAVSKILSDFKKSECHFDVDITRLSTMKLKSQGHYLVVDHEELSNVIQALCENKIPFKMIGWGANQILPLDAREVLYVKIRPPGNPQEIITKIKDTFILPASLGVNVLVASALKLGFIGWEVLTGIPASLGGASFMNAGTKYGEIAKIIKNIYIINNEGKEYKVSITKDSYSYRKNNFLKPHEVISKIEIQHFGIDQKITAQKITEYMDYRKKTQPLQSNNCGCIFKNMDGISAGKIIDELGLKGFQVGGMRISHLHGNFLENIGNSTDQEFWQLVNFIQEKVERKFNRKLELEISN